MSTPSRRSVIKSGAALAAGAVGLSGTKSAAAVSAAATVHAYVIPGTGPPSTRVDA